MKKGLTREQITLAAVRLIEEQGYSAFSLRELASALGVKPASLYNHLDGIEEICISVAEYAAGELELRLAEAMSGKPAPEAFICGAGAYRQFAEENAELYRALIAMPKSDSARSYDVGGKCFGKFLEILHGYGLNAEERTHFIRIFRSMMHGFIDLCYSGYMTHGDADRDESFHVMIRGYLASLLEYAKKKGAGVN